MDREFSFRCEGTPDIPHPVVTDHRLALKEIPAPPACFECGRQMQPIQPVKPVVEDLATALRGGGDDWHC